MSSLLRIDYDVFQSGPVSIKIAKAEPTSDPPWIFISDSNRVPPRMYGSCDARPCIDRMALTIKDAAATPC